MNPIWEESFAIATYHTDPFGNLKIASLFELFQDAASRDAARKGFGYYNLVEKGIFWVLIRVEAEIQRMPAWEEEITFRTWPKDMAGIVAFRDFEILSKTGKTLISGTSSWSQVNLKTRRPMRIDLVVDNNTLPDKHAMEKRAEKIVNPADLLWHDPLQVRSSHIDVNWHVNNTQYLDWIINELPIEWIKDKTLARIGINFLAEGKLNDIVSVGLSHSSELEWSACVRRDGNNGDLCRVKLTFAERN